MTRGQSLMLTDKGWQHFEEIQRIPMVVRFPDGQGAGETREGLISLADVYPTILDLAGNTDPSANVPTWGGDDGKRGPLMREKGRGQAR